MAKELICDKHDKVIKTLKSIRKNIDNALQYYSEDADKLEDLLGDIDIGLYDCVDVIEEAKEDGKSMEARLSLYRQAIEDLGFKRE